MSCIGIKALTVGSRMVLFAAAIVAVHPSAQAQTNYQQLLSFGPTAVTGSLPRGALVQSSDGYLYGTTFGGGTNGWGTIYKVRPNGAGHQVLHEFLPPMQQPEVGLIEATNGMLYGTVRGGGAWDNGVVYRINKNGSSFQSIHDFGSVVDDGISPVAGLLCASDGLLYGSAAGGGSATHGILFRIAQDGSGYTVLFRFAGTNGSKPSAALIEGKDGRLYGTCRRGGSADLGVVFAVNKDGSNLTVLRHFLGQPLADGREPVANLCQADDNLLYGTTYLGGAFGVGTFFRVDTNGNSYSVLYQCQSTANNGSQPLFGFSQGPDGFLYGTTFRGGSGFGIAFKMPTSGGSLTLLHDFKSGADGDVPYSPLLQGQDGALYGSTQTGGANNLGTIYRLLASAPGRFSWISKSLSGVQLQFENGAHAKSYTIERRPNLATGSWQAIGSETAGLDGKFVYTDANPPAGNSHFYRAVSQ